MIELPRWAFILVALFAGYGFAVLVLDILSKILHLRNQRLLNEINELINEIRGYGKKEVGE